MEKGAFPCVLNELETAKNMEIEKKTSSQNSGYAKYCTFLYKIEEN